MSDFIHKQNKDDVAERNILVGVLSTLNKRLKLTNVRSGGVKESMLIPFYYSFAGGDDFLYDSFMKPLFNNETKAESHYEIVPRGVIQYESSTISVENKTNPHVYGQLLETLDNNERKQYYAKYRPIPIEMNINCKIYVSSTLELFKVSEELKKSLYKNILFDVEINNHLVPGVIMIPEDIQKNKLFEFNFDEKKQFEITFDLTVFSYIPDYDEDSKIFAGNRMQRGIIHNTIFKSNNKVTDFVTNNIKTNKPKKL